MPFEIWRNQVRDSLVGNEDEVFCALKGFVVQLGFTYCSYVIRMPLLAKRLNVLWLNNYPVDWAKRYESNSYLKTDPSIIKALSTPYPVIWSQELFEQMPEIWSEAASYGLCHGWAQSARSSWGAVGVLTVARGATPLCEAEISGKHAYMDWLTLVTHEAMSAILVPRHMPEICMQLSEREKEVLRWAAFGKTTSETAQILNIALGTTRTYEQRAIAKMGAASKFDAALIAAALQKLY